MCGTPHESFTALVDIATKCVEPLMKVWYRWWTLLQNMWDPSWKFDSTGGHCYKMYGTPHERLTALVDIATKCVGPLMKVWQPWWTLLQNVWDSSWKFDSAGGHCYKMCGTPHESLTALVYIATKCVGPLMKDWQRWWTLLQNVWDPSSYSLSHWIIMNTQDILTLKPNFKIKYLSLLVYTFRSKGKRALFPTFWSKGKETLFPTFWSKGKETLFMTFWSKGRAHYFLLSEVREKGHYFLLSQVRRKGHYFLLS